MTVQIRPVFLEIKERTNNIILKRRAPVRRDAVAELLAGQTDDPSPVTEPKHFGGLEDFCERMYELEARPKVHVAYYREAYMSGDDNSFRLTMDREVRVAPVPPPSPEKEQSGAAVRVSTEMENPTLIWGHDVVLEAKFTDRFPDMFRDLVRVFGLRQCGAAKYVDGVATLGEHRL
jgi:hypothetical protein